MKKYTHPMNDFTVTVPETHLFLALYAIVMCYAIQDFTPQST